jgi:hypothetical protein
LVQSGRRGHHQFLDVFSEEGREASSMGHPYQGFGRRGQRWCVEEEGGKEKRKGGFICHSISRMSTVPE